MNATICNREDELLDALERGYVGAELASHVATCVACRELHAVAGALLDDRNHAMVEASVPTAATMWWRMRLRAKQDAEAAARRSLLIGQAATLFVAIALAIAFFGVDLLRFVAKSHVPWGTVGAWLVVASITAVFVQHARARHSRRM